MYRKNTAGQYLYFTVISRTDGSPLTSAVSGYRTIDGAGQNAVTGTLTHIANGQWELALSTADTNGDNIGFLFTHATGVNVSISITTTSQLVVDMWAKTGAITSLSFELLLERLYEMINNKMIVTEATGAVALRNLADGADVATGNVQDLGATTQRNALTWV